MEEVIRLSKAELERLRNSIVATINERKNKPAESKTGRIIIALFKLYIEDPHSFYPGWKLRQLAWPEDGKKTTSEGKIRTAVGRARDVVRTYFRNAGWQEPYRIEIEEREYRLNIVKHEPSDIEPLQIITPRTETILGLLCSQKSPFTLELVAEATKAARRAGFLLQVAFHNENSYEESRQLDALFEQCTGVALVTTVDKFAEGAGDLVAHILRLERKNYPMVFINHKAPGCMSPLIGFDNEKGGWLAAQILQSELCCDDIRIFAQPGSYCAEERIAGARRYLRKVWGKNYKPHIEFGTSRSDISGRKFGTDLCEELATRATRNNIGVLATDALLAEGFREACPASELNRSDVFVMGFDFDTTPRLSLREDFARIGREAIAVLVQLVEHHREGFGRSYESELSRRLPLTFLPLERVWGERPPFTNRQRIGGLSDIVANSELSSIEHNLPEHLNKLTLDGQKSRSRSYNHKDNGTMSHWSFIRVIE